MTSAVITWRDRQYQESSKLDEVTLDQRMTQFDPLLPFRTLASLSPIDLTADIRREGRGGSR